MWKSLSMAGVMVAAILLAAVCEAQWTPKSGPASTARTAEPYWLAHMKRIHANFKGESGYVVQLGDSITYSKAFWSPLGYADPAPLLGDDGLPKTPKDKKWSAVIKGTDDKGVEHGNMGGWTVKNELAVIDKVLETHTPEVAIIMLGTNDFAHGVDPEQYQADLVKIVRKCLDANCIPIVSTIPPMRGRLPQVQTANVLVREVALRLNVPLVDYYAEILRRTPKWDGTLISQDGVHPSGGKTDDFSEENLNRSGYALRTWLSFLKYREVYFRVIAPVKG